MMFSLIVLKVHLAHSLIARVTRSIQPAIPQAIVEESTVMIILPARLVFTPSKLFYFSHAVCPVPGGVRGVQPCLARGSIGFIR